MSKAIITGFVTGIIISGILIGATYIRGLLPDTFTANLFFLVFFFSSIACALWVSLNIYCKTSAVRWMTLTITGVVASVIAAVLVSVFQSPSSLVLYNFRDLMAVLSLTSLTIAAIYYMTNRNRSSQDHSKNQELIF